jgi:hypothetical protein
MFRSKKTIVRPPLQNSENKVSYLVWDRISLTMAIRYKIYIELYQRRWIGEVLAADCAQDVYKNFNYML